MGTLHHALPFYFSILATAGYVLPYLSYLPGRCEMECAIPGQGKRYQGMLGVLERVHLRAGPLEGTHALAATEYGADMHGCMAVSLWLVVYIGALLPCWVLGLMEAQAWRRWQRQPGLGSTRLVLNVCGMAVASAACLLLAEQAALWLG